MSEPSPSIFRSLERTAGRDGFDTIVRAAVAAYAPLRRPTQRQCREFGGLVMPLFDRTDRETRRMLAASLAAVPRMPRVLIERLLREPIEVAAPFLLGSPLLTESDIAFLHSRGEPPLDRLLAARRPVSARPADGATDGVGPAPSAVRPDHEGSLRQTTLMSMGSSETTATTEGEEVAMEAVADRLGGEDEAREALRRLATTGRRAAKPKPRPVAEETDSENPLLDLARRRDVEGLRETLARKLVVSPEEAGALMANESGKPLASALKALGLGLADAMTILMMTSPTIGADVAAFEAMQTHYAALDADACAARFGLLPVPVAAPLQHVPQFETTTGSVRQRSATPTFGRRKPLALELASRRQGR